MRRPRWLLIVLAGWLAVPALALPEAGPDELERNRRLLERWKADPEHYRRLLEDFRAFWESPPDRQERLRRLDRELHETDSATQQRLWGVLERYRLWLERLPESDRERVLNAPDKRRRLQIIKELREREWVDRLPQALRNELLTIEDPRKRAARIAEVRREDRQIRRLLQRPPRPRVPPGLRPAKLEQFPPEVQRFVTEQLLPHLGPAEKQQLERAGKARWPFLARTILLLSERHPVLPPLPGKAVTRYADLSPALREQLPRRAVEKKLRQEMQKAEGKWPEFALAFTHAYRQVHRRPPPPLGASRPGEFPPAARAFLVNKLLPALGKDEANALAGLEGRWPDYPHRLLELARRHRLVIPGMSLPGPPALWEGARAALPEVPGHVLRDFALNELTPADRARLGLSAADPEAGRQKLKEAFFQKHPRELRRLRQLDRRVLLSGTP
jgi:hypothetical protein